MGKGGLDELMEAEERKRHGDTPTGMVTTVEQDTGALRGEEELQGETWKKAMHG
jgi:hypothetical protein